MPYKISTKECSLCHKIRPLSKFKVGKNIANICNSCNKTFHTKVCNSCGTQKDIKQFYRNHNIWGVCTECHKGAEEAIKNGYELGFKVLDKLKESLYTNDNGA